MSKSAIFDGKPVLIPKFRDNQPGTIPLIEWKQQLEQHAQEDSNNVGVRVLWGTTTAIPSGTTQEQLKAYYHDLIVWPDRHREKTDKYLLVPFGPDQEGADDEIQPGDITPEGAARRSQSNNVEHGCYLRKLTAGARSLCAHQSTTIQKLAATSSR